MKLGDLVRARPQGQSHDPLDLFEVIDRSPINGLKRACAVPLVEEDWIGIIIGWDRRGGGCDPIVMWSERFPDEVEYKEQLEVISEAR